MNYMTKAQGKAGTAAQKIDLPKVDAGPSFDWPRIGTELDSQGYAVIASLMSPNMCNALAQTYADEAQFRRLDQFVMGDAHRVDRAIKRS